MAHYKSATVTRLQDNLRANLRSAGNPYDANLNQRELVKFIQRHGHLDAVQEVAKSNVVAASLRNTANRLYLERKFDDALVCYNESICYAEVDSDQLGMGYANRSAVYFETGEYELALQNIDLARKHDYPERLMAKLVTREQNCKQQIANGHSRGTVPCPRLDINVDTNPRIPFLADGIKMSYDSKFGRGLVAEKDFNPGDIILNEKIEMCGINFELCYQRCNQCCAIFYYSLIPCPTCTFYMYCSQECRELNWKLYHRFECGMATKLCTVSCITEMLFSRLFLYGLSQFDDNLQAMMDYCDPKVTTASNPLDLDFTNLNRLELFKALHNAKPRYSVQSERDRQTHAACSYTVFLMNPAVTSIIRTQTHRLFLLRALGTYSEVALTLLSSGINAEGQTTHVIRPIGSLINHSCDPNATITIDSGHVKVCLLRPVRKGEQIFTFYGTSWWLPDHSIELHFKCQCIFCDQGPAGREWRKKHDRPLPPKAQQDIRILQAVINGGEQNNATELNAIQQFIKRYEHLHPQGKDLGQVLRLYHFSLCKAEHEANVVLQRAKLQAFFVED